MMESALAQLQGQYSRNNSINQCLLWDSEKKYRKNTQASVLFSAAGAGTRKRLAAKDFRREGVYNRTENPSVTFCGKEERRNKAKR